MNGNRIHYLDGLRGVLAVIVFIHHFLYIFYPEAMLGGPYKEFMQPGITMWKIIGLTPLNILFNPNMAINFFFLLSGYVQSYHYLKNPDLKLLQSSFVKRYFRLAIPTLVIVLLVFSFSKLHFVHKELLPQDTVLPRWAQNQMPDNLNFLQAIKYALFDCFNGNRSYYQVLWTMPVELLNSWMVLILLMVTHKFRQKMGLFIFWFIMQAVVLGSTHSLLFTIGLMLCHMEIYSVKFKTVFSTPLIKYSCLLLGLYFASFPYLGYDNSIKRTMYAPVSFFEGKHYLYTYIIGNFLLFCFILRSHRVKIIFSKKIFQYFGSISLMFYLVHFLILFSFSPIVYSRLRSALGFSAGLTITFFATFGVITGVSYVLTRFVDVPSLKLGNRYVKKLFFEE